MKPPLTESQIARKKKVTRIVGTILAGWFTLVGLIPLASWLFVHSFRHVSLVKVIACTLLSFAMAVWIFWSARSDK
jgi:uncharacterized membrane protein